MDMYFITTNTIRMFTSKIDFPTGNYNEMKLHWTEALIWTTRFVTTMQIIKLLGTETR